MASVGPHPMDPLSLGVQHEPFWPLRPVDLRGLRVAYTEDFGAYAVDPMIRRVFSERVQVISREAAVCEPLDWDLSDGRQQRNCYEWLSLTYMVTLATLPALFLPCGRDEAGMPFGLQMVAPLHRDARLLGMAAALEQWGRTQADWGRPRPDMGALSTPCPELRSIVTHPPLHTGGESVPMRTAV